ncbi:hypothetical protein Y1Q_0002457 [Alligator mississippiensis]|uniref:Uncharacterized protein n=1 Tax=Alligator mississippiensis TaxID=8496 RepID=A0A151NBD8_ALLMI|nr:hypothetical protein Y1Q_0002457 [Alligator mississippiensis]
MESEGPAAVAAAHSSPGLLREAVAVATCSAVEGGDAGSRDGSPWKGEPACSKGCTPLKWSPGGFSSETPKFLLKDPAAPCIHRGDGASRQGALPITASEGARDPQPGIRVQRDVETQNCWTL